MMGEQEALVLEVRPFDVHGVTYQDVTIALRDRSVHHARLGPEGVPAGLQKGDVVLATRVANMIVSLRRPLEDPPDWA
jgi:hypothetical protein